MRGRGPCDKITGKGRKICMEAKIRRQQNNLFFSSLAIILFGAWGSLRVVIFNYLNPDVVLNQLDSPLDPTTLKIIMVTVTVVVGIMDVLIRLRIGLPAIRESRGIVHKKKNTYLTLAIIYLCADIYGLFSFVFSTYEYVSNGQYAEAYNSIKMTSSIIQLTSCIAISQLVIATIKLKKLRRRIATV